jgi:carbon storage regulator
MLVLTRKLNEKIVIGDSIEVMIVEIRPDRVRLGIAADKSVPVHREEVYRAIQAEQELTAAAAPLAPRTPK